MAKKKAPKASTKKVKRAIKQLEADVDAANAKAARWKKRAKQRQSDAETAQAEVAKLEKKLAKSRREAPVAPVPAAVEVVPVAGEPSEPGEPVAATPDETWTFTALRAEARSRGIAGYSRKSKADLVADLA